MATEKFGSVEITGAKELEKFLDSLTPEIRKKVERKTLRQALKPMLESSIAKAPVGETGNLANSLKISIKKARKKGNIFGEVKTSKSGSDPQSKGHHAHLVEFGHEIVTPGGRRTGERVPPYPFMRPAFDETADKQIQTLVDGVRKEIEKQARKTKPK